MSFLSLLKSCIAPSSYAITSDIQQVQNWKTNRIKTFPNIPNKIRNDTENLKNSQASRKMKEVEDSVARPVRQSRKWPKAFPEPICVADQRCKQGRSELKRKPCHTVPNVFCHFHLNRKLQHRCMRRKAITRKIKLPSVCPKHTWVFPNSCACPHFCYSWTLSLMQILKLQMQEVGLKKHIRPQGENPIDIYWLQPKNMKVSSQIGVGFCGLLVFINGPNRCYCGKKLLPHIIFRLNGFTTCPRFEKRLCGTSLSVRFL